MPFFKGLIPGSLLTWILAGLLGSNQVRGGILAIFHTTIAGHGIYWSWPLFVVLTGLATALYWMMGD